MLRDERYAKELIRVPRAQVTVLGVNPTLYAPFHDKRLRQALSLAIDRPAMIRGLYGGAAFLPPARSPRGSRATTRTTPEPRYDPARAKQLLAEAGFPGGKGLPPVDISSTDA